MTAASRTPWARGGYRASFLPVTCGRASDPLRARPLFSTVEAGRTACPGNLQPGPRARLSTRRGFFCGDIGAGVAA